MLTPDYFIPDDISKIYVISTTVTRAGSRRSYNQNIKWEGVNKYTFYETDFDKNNCNKDNYVIDGKKLKWIRSTFYSNGNGHCENCISGSCVLIEPVSVGEKWGINYVTSGQLGTRTWIREGQFIGMEDITVMGLNMKCAHVRINTIC